MPRIQIDIQITISEEFVQDMAVSIMEDWPLPENQERHSQQRLAAQTEFRDLVAEHLRSSIQSQWDIDPWDYADVGELENLVLTDPGAREFDWLREIYAQAEAEAQAEEEQERLLEEARRADQNQQQSQINAAMIRQLQAQGYVVYANPRRRR